MLTETEIIEKTSYSESKFYWIYKHNKTPKMLLIYVSTQGLIIIPKKYCLNDQQYENICNLVANFPQGN